MSKNIYTVKFTRFDNSSNWVSGECEGYLFDAKLFDEGSAFGINNGRVSKLSIENKNGLIANYDRGWDIKPTKEHNPFYIAILSFLETSQKRFEATNL